MKDGVLSPLAYVSDDHVGLWYEGIEATSVAADNAYDATNGPAAYRVELQDGEVVETRVGVGKRFN